MTELTLTRAERLQLKARAHHLKPVVLLGAAGLSDAVVREIDRALDAHELIKIRVPGDERDEREQLCADLAARLGAARVQMIGKLLVLYRPRPEESAPAKPAPPTRAERAAFGARRKPQREDIRRTQRRVIAPRGRRQA